MLTFKVTGLYACILYCWNLYLVLYVVYKRNHLKIGLGDGGNLEMLKAIRIHGNAIEHIPLFLILMIIAESFPQPYNQTYFLHTLGTLFVLARIIHYKGICKHASRSIERVLSTCLTLLCGITLALFNAYHALSMP